MERKQVFSSSIKEIGYEADTNLLEVSFTSGAVYRYSGVSKEVADTFLQAEGKGHHFQAFIRPCFPCERVHALECAGYLKCTVHSCLCWCHGKRELNAEVKNVDLTKELRASIQAVKKKTAKRR